MMKEIVQGKQAWKTKESLFVIRPEMLHCFFFSFLFQRDADDEDDD
jgi:hypothetical protein